MLLYHLLQKNQPLRSNFVCGIMRTQIEGMHDSRDFYKAATCNLRRNLKSKLYLNAYSCRHCHLNFTPASLVRQKGNQYGKYNWCQAY